MLWNIASKKAKIFRGFFKIKIIKCLFEKKCSEFSDYKGYSLGALTIFLKSEFKAGSI